MKKLLLTLMIAMIPTFVWAHSYNLGNIAIGHAWMRAVPNAGGNGAAYFPLMLNGKNDEFDVLQSVSTPIAESAMFHKTEMADGVASMKMIAEIKLLTGQPIAMKPGGLHVMLMNVKQPVKKGDKVPMTLTFKKAGKIDIELQVEDVGASHSGH